MPLLVASLTEETPQAMIRAANRADADVVEIRLDALRDVSQNAIEEIARDLGKPGLATLRPTWEGGRYGGTESQRERLLAHAVDAGFEYVDVEAAASIANGLVHHAGRRGARVILSRHDLEGTPPASGILAHLRDVRKRGAWCGKLATRVRDAADAAALVEAAQTARREGLRFALMGVNDAFLRLLAPALGQTLTYVAANPESRAAPGQPLASEARLAHRALEPAITARTARIYLFGDPVGHSLSPAFQNAALRAVGLDAVYLAAPVPPERLAAAVSGLSATGAIGANLTLPHKETVLPLLEVLAPSAQKAGAVNVVVNEGGRLVGHNTDGIGALRALRHAGVDVDGERVLVLGAGGAARAVSFSLKEAGADVTLANRTRERSEALAHEVVAAVADWPVRDVSPFHVVVNCTSVGLDTNDSPLQADALRKGLVVLDAAYRADGETPLAAAARRAGCTVIDGKEMLLQQGVAAFELWTGERAPLNVMREALGGLPG